MWSIISNAGAGILVAGLLTILISPAIGYFAGDVNHAWDALAIGLLAILIGGVIFLIVPS